jgi:regulator of protease activity HflC (stomatin/prohibitin superfamily)
VSITHLAFGKEFTKAIEQKQVAQQDAERSKFLVQRAEQEKQAAIIRAQGESEAATLISEALRSNGTGMIEVKRIDVRWRPLCCCAARPSRVHGFRLCASTCIVSNRLVVSRVRVSRATDSLSRVYVCTCAQAAREIAESLARSRNVTYLPSGGSNVLLQLRPSGGGAPMPPSQ